MPTIAGEAMASSASIPDTRNPPTNLAAPKFASATYLRDTGNNPWILALLRQQHLRSDF